MESVENPFWNRKRITDPRYFVGREAEIRTIFRAIKTGQSLSIVGPRRIGKSSLLTHVRHPDVRAKYRLGDQYILVYINCQEMIGEVTRADVHQKLGDELEKADPNHVHSYEPSKVATFSLLQQRVQEITNDGKSIIFLLDEFESLASNNALDVDFFSQLRALSETQSVVYLTASAQTLYDLSYHDDSVLGSPFFNTFSLLRLGLMGTHEAQSLIMTLLQMVPSIKFDEDDLQFIRHCGGTHPFFVQIVCDLLFETKASSALRQNQPNYARIEQDFWDQAQGHFDYIWQGLSVSMRVALQAMCKHEEFQLAPDHPKWFEYKGLLYEGRLFSSVFAKYILDKPISSAAIEANNTPAAAQSDALKIIGELNPAQRWVAREIFAGGGYKASEFDLLAGGYANYGIYRVVFKPYRKRFPQVLKFASAKDIDQELVNYKSLVKDKLEIVADEPFYWFPPNLHTVPKAEWSRELAAVVYPYAKTYGQKVTTLEKLYAHVLFTGSTGNKPSTNQIEDVFTNLFHALDSWQRHASKNQSIISLRAVYGRLGHNLEKIEQNAHNLPELGFHRPSFASLRRKKKFLWRGKKYVNPIYWVNQLFSQMEEPGWLKQLAVNCPLGLVHGDLNYRNILVEQSQDRTTNIWLIDFVDTHEGHVLRDYGMLEAELKCFLTPLGAEDFMGGMPPILQLEQQLLKAEVRDMLDLQHEEMPDSCLKTPKLRGIWEHARLIRRQAKKEKYLADTDVRPYYFSLLHATLPIVYYSQLTEWQRLYAFLSAALICEKIDLLNKGAQSQALLNPRPTNNFDGFVQIQIFNEQQEEITINEQNTFILLPKSHYHLKITIQTQKPPSGKYASIFIDDGEDSSVVAFTIQLDADTLQFKQTVFHVNVKSFQDTQSAESTFLSPLKSGKYEMYVEVGQYSTTVAWINIVFEIQ